MIKILFGVVAAPKYSFVKTHLIVYLRSGHIMYVNHISDTFLRVPIYG